MSLQQTSPPALEPVELNTARIHLRVEHDGEDTLIAGLISAARQIVEHRTGLALIARGWTQYLDQWPDSGEVSLAIAPVRAVHSVKVVAVDDSISELAPESYITDLASRPARLVCSPGHVWPAPGKPVNGIAVALSAGFGDSREHVPEPLRQAVLQLAGHWYENRTAVADSSAVAVPLGVSALLAPYRAVRL